MEEGRGCPLIPLCVNSTAWLIRPPVSSWFFLIRMSPHTYFTVSRSLGCRIEIVNQHHADQLDFDQTPLNFMLSK